jgi:uncharacterized protein YjbI with pentapeptide repeats
MRPHAEHSRYIAGACLILTLNVSLTAVTANAPLVINGCPIRPATLCGECNLQNAKLAGADLARADF